MTRTSSLILLGALGALALAATGAPSQAPAAPAPAPAGDAVTFTFTGRGWGHGVGLSQYGARGRVAGRLERGAHPGPLLPRHRPDHGSAAQGARAAGARSRPGGASEPAAPWRG